MIQPYFKPDMNPSMPAFATFYNGYFQERSKMNMQMMDLMLRQASPEYLTKMIDRTQKNIEELQKTRAKIIQSSQKDQMDLIKLQTRMQLEVNKANASVNRRSLETIQKAIIGGGRGNQRRFDPDKASLEQANIQSKKNLLQRQMTDKTYRNNPTGFLKDAGLSPQDKPDVGEVALALEVLTENQTQIAKDLGAKFKVDVEQVLKDIMGGADPNTILANKYPNTRGGSASTTVSTPSESRIEELGFTLTPSEIAFGDGFIAEKNGRLEIKEFQEGPYINRQYSTLPDNEKDIVQKRMKQRILQEKKGYVRAPKVKMPSQQDLQSTLDYIDEQLATESSKLQGYLTRYDVGQRDVLEQVFSPFESNYRTDNLFKRKSPEVLQQEKEIREMQYATRDDTPSGYQNIKYNTEYQAPGGLNFGITKVGQEEIPYIFEGDKPYEIQKTDPSHSFILELLAEQDRKLGER